MARAANTYRSARRNEARDMGVLRGWRFLRLSAKANHEAKLKQRAEACAAARTTLAKAFASGGMVGLDVRAVPIILADFWRKQPVSRVRSRILRELRA